MKIWLIWVQADDGYTWLEGSWTDDATAENHEGWLKAVEDARRVAVPNKCEVRIQAVNVPGVFDLFKIPEVRAEAAS